VISLNQALDCEAEAPCFTDLVLGYTPDDADYYTPVITKRRANSLIKQLFWPDIEHMRQSLSLQAQTSLSAIRGAYSLHHRSGC
jgi:hypothetical protein